MTHVAADIGGLERIRGRLDQIRSAMMEAERRFAGRHSSLSANQRASAINLLHYLALRREDLRALQDDLVDLGLSSLGRSEAGALASVQAVLDVAEYLINRSAPAAGDISASTAPPAGIAEGRRMLDRNARALLGDPQSARDVRIIVTMPSAAADDYQLVLNLLEAGMDCVRINTAHDTPAAWDRMLHHLERARQATGRSCRVMMDLAGPKPRTGAIAPGPPLLKWRPRRDAYGHVIAPARVWLTSNPHAQAPVGVAAANLHLDEEWLSRVDVGDTIKFKDARNAKRLLRIVARTEEGCLAEAVQTAYVVAGTTFQLSGRGSTRAANLPALEQRLILRPGDALMLLRTDTLGSPATLGPCGEVLSPARVSVTSPNVFDDVRPGEPIWFDDGRIGGVLREITTERVEVTITRAKPEGARLRSEKGINLPDSHLALPALTPRDLDALPFIAAHADLVGYSFVQSEADVYELQSRLATFDRSLGIVLKIESRRAFERLPALLLAAMRNPVAGVMVARGDLAIECGYERLAEVQEEILWMAEASHMPVIWATDVMENMAKKGAPSRAEVTDAAMSERAEGVLLNKGRYILEAVRALDNILTRMQAHQKKKSTMLRHLELADRFFESAEPTASRSAGR